MHYAKRTILSKARDFNSTFLTKSSNLKMIIKWQHACKREEKYCHFIFLLPTYTNWKKEEEEGGGGVCGK